MFTKAPDLKPRMTIAEYNRTSIFMYLLVNYELAVSGEEQIAIYSKMLQTYTYDFLSMSDPL
jgi:hypothetical protein